MRSLNSVKIKYAYPEKIKKSTMSLARKLASEHKEIESIIWFGSYIKGLPTPYSDVDLCIIISHSEKPVKERIPDYLPTGFPVGLDIFPYTEEEFNSLKVKAPLMHNAIINGKEIYKR